MNIVRAEQREKFAIIPNAALENETLSWRARGILAYLLSRPPGWETDSVKLAALASEGRDAVRTALAELVKAGYMRRVRSQLPTGLWRTDILVFDHPEPPEEPTEEPVDKPAPTEDGFPGVGDWKSAPPTPGKPDVGWPGATNKTDTKTTNPSHLETRHLGDDAWDPDECPHGADRPDRCALCRVASGRVTGRSHHRRNDDGGTRWTA